VHTAMCAARSSSRSTQPGVIIIIIIIIIKHLAIKLQAGLHVILVLLLCVDEQSTDAV